jgi:hypothetical protein
MLRTQTLEHHTEPNSCRKLGESRVLSAGLPAMA